MIRNNVRRRTVESISVNSRQRKQWKNLQVRQDLHPPPPLSGEGVGGGVSLSLLRSVVAAEAPPPPLSYRNGWRSLG